MKLLDGSFLFYRPLNINSITRVLYSTNRFKDCLNRWIRVPLLAVFLEAFVDCDEDLPSPVRAGTGLPWRTRSTFSQTRLCILILLVLLPLESFDCFESPSLKTGTNQLLIRAGFTPETRRLASNLAIQCSLQFISIKQDI